MRKAVLLVGLVSLSACDDVEGASEGLAQCMLSKKAHADTGAWDASYLSLCMRAKGFVEDGEQFWGGVRCRDLPHPIVAAGCYRSEGWFARWRRELWPRS
jgi:hypothetical protein